MGSFFVFLLNPLWQWFFWNAHTTTLMNTRSCLRRYGLDTVHLQNSQWHWTANVHVQRGGGAFKSWQGHGHCLHECINSLPKSYTVWVSGFLLSWDWISYFKGRKLWSEDAPCVLSLSYVPAWPFTFCHEFKLHQHKAFYCSWISLPVKKWTKTKLFLYKWPSLCDNNKKKQKKCTWTYSYKMQHFQKVQKVPCAYPELVTKLLQNH